MTAHLPIVPRKPVDRPRTLGFAPPAAPLHMPKQVLTPAPRALRRALRRGLARLIAALPPGRHRPG